MDALTALKHRYSYRNRSRKADFAVSFGRSHGVRSVLLVGVDGRRDAVGNVTPTTNLIENAIISAFERTVASGMRPQAAGWPSYIQCSGLALPFDDDSFDLVYSNAVIEHVGQEPEQRQFAAEHARVGKHWILTTPNRLFPIESHTMTVGKHMSQRWRPPRPAYTRLLSKRDFREVLPDGAKIEGVPFGPTFTATSA